MDSKPAVDVAIRRAGARCRQADPAQPARLLDPARAARAADRRYRGGAQDRLRSGDPRRHLRAGPDLQDRRRRRPQHRHRYDADGARLPGCRRDAGVGRERGRRRAGRRPGRRSSSPSIRPGTRTACRTRPSSRWACSDASAERGPLQERLESRSLRFGDRWRACARNGGLRPGSPAGGAAPRSAGTGPARVSQVEPAAPSAARQGFCDGVGGRKRQGMPDRNENDILDGLGVVRQSERTRPAKTQHPLFPFTRTGLRKSLRLARSMGR